MRRLAYLITAYGEWVHLERLIGALDAPGVGIFVHIDAKSAVPQDVIARLTERGNVWFAPRRRVWWGGWSHTEALLSLMKLAASQSADYDYCVLLSGADYPIRSHEQICAALFSENGTKAAKTASDGLKTSQNCEFINAYAGFRPDKPESRVQNYWCDGFDRRRLNSLKTIILRWMEIALAKLGIQKRRYPFEQIYVGIVWSALTMACVRYIVDYVRVNPRYRRFFSTSLVAEEMFFQTIVGNSPFGANIRGTLTWMDWSANSASPPRVGPEHLKLLAPDAKTTRIARGMIPEPLFARKFDDRSGPELDYIDQNWRK